MPFANLLEGNPNMVNLLRVPGEQQVMLMVTVAEVNRTAARTIGMDFSIVNGRFAMPQDTGGLLTTAAGGHECRAGPHPSRREPPYRDRQRQRAHGDPGPANLELRAEFGGTKPDHAQWEAGELSGRRLLPHSHQHRYCREALRKA